jgi:hypothetical protein
MRYAQVADEVGNEIPGAYDGPHTSLYQRDLERTVGLLMADQRVVSVQGSMDVTGAVSDINGTKLNPLFVHPSSVHLEDMNLLDFQQPLSYLSVPSSDGSTAAVRLSMDEYSESIKTVFTEFDGVSWHPFRVDGERLLGLLAFQTLMVDGLERYKAAMVRGASGTAGCDKCHSLNEASVIFHGEHHRQLLARHPEQERAVIHKLRRKLTIRGQVTSARQQLQLLGNDAHARDNSWWGVYGANPNKFVPIAELHLGEEGLVSLQYELGLQDVQLLRTRVETTHVMVQRSDSVTGAAIRALEKVVSFIPSHPTPHPTQLDCSALQRATPHHTTPHRTTLRRNSTRHDTTRHDTTHHSTPHHTMPRHKTTRHDTTHLSTPCHVTPLCATPRRDMPRFDSLPRHATPRHTTPLLSYCSLLTTLLLTAHCSLHHRTTAPLHSHILPLPTCLPAGCLLTLLSALLPASLSAWPAPLPA